MALSELQKASEDLGRLRLGRLSSRLKAVAEALGDSVQPCIRGCWGSREPRCIVGDILDRLVAVVQGASLRLERSVEGETTPSKQALEALEILVDTLYALVEAVCKSSMLLD